MKALCRSVGGRWLKEHANGDESAVQVCRRERWLKEHTMMVRKTEPAEILSAAYSCNNVFT